MALQNIICHTLIEKLCRDNCVYTDHILFNICRKHCTSIREFTFCQYRCNINKIFFFYYQHFCNFSNSLQIFRIGSQYLTNEGNSSKYLEWMQYWASVSSVINIRIIPRYRDLACFLLSWRNSRLRQIDLLANNIKSNEKKLLTIVFFMHTLKQVLLITLNK